MKLNVLKSTAIFTVFLAFLFMTEVQGLNSTQTLPKLMLCLIILVLSWLKQDRDRESSAAEGNYHLMIFCFFLFQQPLALHAPEVYREEMCVRVCVWAWVWEGWWICYVETGDV